MGKFYEYPAPSGLADGTEKVVIEKDTITYSAELSFISIASLGDVDITGLTDNSILIWSNTNQKWEIGTNASVVNSINDIGDVTITTPVDTEYLTYSGGQWVNSTFPSIPSSLNDLSDVDITGIDDQHFLIWHGENNEWFNVPFPTPISTLAGLTDTTITSPVDGQFLNYSGGSWVNVDPSVWNVKHNETYFKATGNWTWDGTKWVNPTHAVQTTLNTETGGGEWSYPYRPLKIKVTATSVPDGDVPTFDLFTNNTYKIVDNALADGSEVIIDWSVASTFDYVFGLWIRFADNNETEYQITDIQFFDDGVAYYSDISTVLNDLNDVDTTGPKDTGDVLAYNAVSQNWEVSSSSGISWSTAVDASIIPDTTDAYDIGSGALRFNSVYANFLRLGDADAIYLGNSSDTFITFDGTRTRINLAGGQPEMQIQSAGIARYHFDHANIRLGIGLSPSYTLDVGGDINISAGSVFRIDGVEFTGGSSFDQSLNTTDRPSFAGLFELSRNESSNWSVMLVGGSASTTGWNNHGIGFGTNQAVTSGTSNIGIGVNCNGEVTTNNYNVSIGENAGQYISGGSNVSIGTSANKGSTGATTGGFNTSVGQSAGLILTSGGENTFVGHSAGSNVTTGSKNICIGKNAYPSNGVTNNVCIIGGDGADVVKTGMGGQRNPQYALDVIGDINISSGSVFRIDGVEFTGGSSFDQDLNTTDTPSFTGMGNLSKSTDATNSVMIAGAGNATATGDNNTFIGISAGLSTTTGANNIYVGENAGRSNTTGIMNVGLSRRTLYYNQGGNNNFAVGNQAGEGAPSPTSFSNGTFIGNRC
jgi:hypothetical protein